MTAEDAAQRPIVDAAEQAADGDERSLRPQRLAEYIGQPSMREQMEIFLGAAKRRSEALDHTLVFGPPGLGKTTLAHVVANELGVNLRVTAGPAIERASQLVGMLTGLGERDVLFIDEIHRINPAIEEFLYPAMEDFRIDIIMGEGPGASSITMPLKPFTLIGATTKAGMLTSPLRDRFPIRHRLEFYSEADLAFIVDRAAGILGVSIEPSGATEIARRSRGTPRIANRLLRRVRDYAEMRADGVITSAVADRALDMLDVDALGFDVMDRKLLLAIMAKFEGGPVGLDNLAAAIGEERGTIEDVIEPYLIQQGYLMRTPRGRVCTPAAWRHLGLNEPDPAPMSGAAGDLFEPGANE